MAYSLSELTLLALVRKKGILRARDLAAEGIPRMHLTRLRRKGILSQPSRGVYVLVGADSTEQRTLAEACKRVPNAVVCLLSALQFHELTTQAPFEVWLAIDRKARIPKVDYPPLRVVRMSGIALTQGVESKKIEGVPAKVTTPARTVVDCFAYRNQVGIDVALEALRDCLRQRKASMDEISRMAAHRRMRNVMRPYLEAIA
jgi:predicted transcriptional regulator of viral defense system